MPQINDHAKSSHKSRAPIIAIISVMLLIFVLLGLASWVKDRKKATELAEACHSEVKSQAKYPSKVAFTETNVDGSRVSGMVDFMNGFGGMIPHTYTCHYGAVSVIPEGQ